MDSQEQLTEALTKLTDHVIAVGDLLEYFKQVEQQKQLVQKEALKELQLQLLRDGLDD